MTAATKEVRTNELGVAWAIASDYQRDLLAGMPKDELRQVNEFAYPEADPAAEDLGPLELRVGERTLTLPARAPNTFERAAADPAAYMRMWARLYELAGSQLILRSDMDRITAEELGLVRHEGGRRDVEGEEDRNSPAARIARGLEPIRPARRHPGYEPKACGACGLPDPYHADRCPHAPRPGAE